VTQLPASFWATAATFGTPQTKTSSLHGLAMLSQQGHGRAGYDVHWVLRYCRQEAIRKNMLLTDAHVNS
jgi:hypothetical protein